jgi:hypothetical protein
MQLAVSSHMVAGKQIRAEQGSADYPRRRPAALEAPVLGLGRAHRPLWPSPRTWLRARPGPPLRAEPGSADYLAVVPPHWRRHGWPSGWAVCVDCCRRLLARHGGCGPFAPSWAGAGILHLSTALRLCTSATMPQLAAGFGSPRHVTPSSGCADPTGDLLGLSFGGRPRHKATGCASHCRIAFSTAVHGPPALARAQAGAGGRGGAWS